MLKSDEVYSYPCVHLGTRNRVARWYKRAEDRKRVSYLPAVVVAFLANTFGSGYPFRRRGKTWIIETRLQHIELEVRNDNLAELRVWAVTSGPAYERPVIDRMISCAED